MLNQRLNLGLGIVCISMSVIACSPGEDEEPGEGDGTSDVEGSWCGREVEADEQCAGDEVSYARLDQSGSVITGEFCESYNKDCYTIQNGIAEGNTISFSYSFESETVSGSFALDGDTLTGSLVSSKCDCTIPMTLHRVSP
ncbi:hypothetical protein WME91_24565 [Sorangium sp. So ce269]